jgi:hypothetical protein
MTFSVFIDIFYPPNSSCFEENRVLLIERLLRSFREEKLIPFEKLRF